MLLLIGCEIDTISLIGQNVCTFFFSFICFSVTNNNRALSRLIFFISMAVRSECKGNEHIFGNSRKGFSLKVRLDGKIGQALREKECSNVRVFVKVFTFLLHSCRCDIHLW